MRSSEVRNLKLFEMRKKNQNFKAIGNQLHSNAFRTTQTAHCALQCRRKVAKEADTLSSDAQYSLRCVLPVLFYIRSSDHHGECDLCWTYIGSLLQWRFVYFWCQAQSIGPFSFSLLHVDFFYGLKDLVPKLLFPKFKLSLDHFCGTLFESLPILSCNNHRSTITAVQ